MLIRRFIDLNLKVYETSTTTTVAATADAAATTSVRDSFLPDQ